MAQRGSSTSGPQLPDETLRHVGAQLGAGAGDLKAAAEQQESGRQRVSSPGRDAWRRFRKNWMAMFSLSLILLMIFVAAFAPFLHTSDPLATNYNALHQSPNVHHWLGTDGVGGDQYSRLLYGLRIPLIVGIVGAAITVLLGMALGVLAGYFGGIADSLLSRFTDLMFAFPAFVLALIIISLFGKAMDPYFGGGGRVILLTFIFAIVGWPFLMRFVRSLVLGLKEQQFIEAARTSGSSSWTIILKHLVPNMWGLILVQASFIVIGTISIESTLSLFGLGVASPNPDLGVMLFDGKDSLGYSPWELTVPAVTLGVLILAGTFLGDGLRDAVDPRGRS